jgi:GAF domain-containing protein
MPRNPDAGALATSEWFESLHRLSSSLASAGSEADVLAVIVDEGARATGAEAAVVGLIAAGQVEVAAQSGYPAGRLDSWSTFPLAAGLPIPDVIASGEAIYCSSLAERDERWPVFRGKGRTESHAFVVLPLVGRGGVMGAVALSFAEDRAFDEGVQHFLSAIASQCALVLERARASAAEQRAAGRLAFLSEASKTLARSLHYEETLDEVGRLAVPQLGDWFACDLLMGGTVELVTVSHVDPEQVRWVWQLRSQTPVNVDAPNGLPNVLRTGTSELYAAGQTPEELALPLEDGFGSMMIVPLVAREQILGALTFVRSESGRHYDDEDLALAEELAGTVAIAIDNSRLYAEQQAARHRAEVVAGRSAELRALAHDLAGVSTPADVSLAISNHLLSYFGGAVAAGLYVFDPARQVMQLTGSGGVTNPELADRFGLVGIDTDLPVAQAARAGEPVWVERLTDFAPLADSPELPAEFLSAAALPVLLDESLLGVFFLVFADERQIDAEDREMLSAVAAQVALPLERARLFEREQIARERTERLQRFTERLAPALTVDSVLDVAISKALVASRGSTAILALVTDDERSIELRRVGGSLSEDAIGPRSFGRDHASAMGEVVRTRAPLWFKNRAEWERFPESVARPSYLQSAVILPVATSERFFGVLGIAFDDEREFPEDERRFFAAVAAQTAQALDRARLYEEQSHIAHILQQSLLPRKLPAIPGIEIATSYQAAGRVNETGGDFYDVFETKLGYMILIGDVCGKGAEAAALTSLCRYTMRAAALGASDARPATLLDVLNEAMLGEDGDFASVACVLLEAAGDEIRVSVASAGHPPVLVRRNDGSLEAHVPEGPLVGVIDDASFEEHSFLLEPGDLMVLYTDGLTDARSETGERVGEDRVREIVAAVGDDLQPQAAAISGFATVLADFEAVDDIAVIALARSFQPAIVDGDAAPSKSRKARRARQRVVPDESGVSVAATRLQA